MFCPKCKAEYRDGFTHCERCDVDLVDVLPADEPEPEIDYEVSGKIEYVSLREFTSEHEVAFFSSILEGAGIRHYFNSVGRYGAAGGASCRLMVDETHLQDAESLLSDADPESCYDEEYLQEVDALNDGDVDYQHIATDESLPISPGVVFAALLIAIAVYFFLSNM